MVVEVSRKKKVDRQGQEEEEFRVGAILPTTINHKKEECVVGTKEIQNKERSWGSVLENKGRERTVTVATP